MNVVYHLFGSNPVRHLGSDNLPQIQGINQTLVPVSLHSNFGFERDISNLRNLRTFLESPHASILYFFKANINSLAEKHNAEAKYYGGAFEAIIHRASFHGYYWACFQFFHLHFYDHHIIIILVSLSVGLVFGDTVAFNWRGCLIPIDIGPFLSLIYQSTFP